MDAPGMSAWFMADSQTQAFAGAIGTPIGAFLIAVAGWYVLRQPCDNTIGSITTTTQCVGSFHDFKAFATAVAGVCTALGWFILVVTGILRWGSADEETSGGSTPSP